jgi:hypothetical protein
MSQMLKFTLHIPAEDAAELLGTAPEELAGLGDMSSIAAALQEVITDALQGYLDDETAIKITP